ncbi:MULTISPECIES: alpha-amylase [Streptomyces]|uniref:Alpha-amylase n=1 Tax=Streptomyces dubilierae TaxID=3075533 RepID=A0ABU2PJM9_9ACTN|nr:alpha-amylase [Streptomyces sp. DSM 41921]MDT0390960.1 alpha-amylase [Streptomyces sp. DSM 41921]
MLRRTRISAWAAAPAAALGLALAVPPGPASATPGVSEPAPSCVVMYESWRYTDAANDCPDTLSVSVLYQDGATSLCSTLAPGARATIGEGYLGRHGRADRLVLCEAP